MTHFPHISPNIYDVRCIMFNVRRSLLAAIKCMLFSMRVQRRPIIKWNFIRKIHTQWVTTVNENSTDQIDGNLQTLHVYYKRFNIINSQKNPSLPLPFPPRAPTFNHQIMCICNICQSTIYRWLHQLQPLYINIRHRHLYRFTLKWLAHPLILSTC